MDQYDLSSVTELPSDKGIIYIDPTTTPEWAPGIPVGLFECVPAVRDHVSDFDSDFVTDLSLSLLPAQPLAHCSALPPVHQPTFRTASRR